MSMRYTLVELIELVRERRTMFLPLPTVECMSAFLTGYTLDHDVGSDARKFLSDFQVWVSGKHGLTTARHWSAIIRFYSSGETTTLDEFFQYYDDFSNDCGDIHKRCDTQKQ